MNFAEGNPESWKTNEVLERKKAVVEILSRALQLDQYLEKTADTAGTLKIYANASNSQGERVVVSVFWMGQDEHEDRYQFYIQSVPTEEEAARHYLGGVKKSHPRYEDFKSQTEEAVREKRPIGLYAIDKVVYDSSEGNPDDVANGAMRALYGKKNGQDIPAGQQDYFDSTYEINNDETLTKYTDDKAETLVSSERALEILEGLTVNDIHVEVNGKQIE